MVQKVIYESSAEQKYNSFGEVYDEDLRGVLNSNKIVHLSRVISFDFADDLLKYSCDVFRDLDTNSTLVLICSEHKNKLIVNARPEQIEKLEKKDGLVQKLKAAEAEIH